MAEMQSTPNALATEGREVVMPQFHHPVLELITSAHGLPDAFESVAHALTDIFDAGRPRQDRLNGGLSIEDLVSPLNLGNTACLQIVHEVWRRLADVIPCAQLWEKCALAELREEGIELGRGLSDSLPDLPFAESGRPQAHTVLRILRSWTELMLRTPLPDFILTVDDGKACIRLVRVYAMLDSRAGWADESHLNLGKRQLAILGLWRQIEDHMRTLAEEELQLGRNRKPARMFSEILDRSQERGLSEAALFDPSYGPQARQMLTSYLLGKAEASLQRDHLSVPSGTQAGNSAGDATSRNEVAVPVAPGFHLVVTGEIPPAAGREDKETLARFQALRSPLPLPRLPGNESLRAALATLHAEFPWATRAIQEIGGELLARERAGSLELAWSPLLLVGPPGCGKSRLARRLAEVFALPFLPMSLAGAHDPKLILGTARSWSSAQPSPLLQFMLSNRCARGVVLLDEIEKTTRWDSGGASIPAILLNLLEVETAKRWYDGFLQVPCDLSKLLFIATANSLSGLSKPLLSRLNMVVVPEPQRDHFPQVVQVVIDDIAREWGVPAGALDGIDTNAITATAGNVRQLRLMVLLALAEQAVLPRVLH